MGSKSARTSKYVSSLVRKDMTNGTLGLVENEEDKTSARGKRAFF